MSTTDQERVATLDRVLDGKSGSPKSWDIWQCLKCRGPLEYDVSNPALICPRLWHTTFHRGGDPDRQTADHGQQPGRPGILRQPTLAEVPVLGEVHVVLQRRRASGPQRRAPAPAQQAGTGPARRGDRRRGLSRLASRRLADRRSGYLAISARCLSPTCSGAIQFGWRSARPKHFPWPIGNSTRFSASAPSTTSTIPRAPSGDGPRGSSWRTDRGFGRGAQFDRPHDRPQAGPPGLDRWIVSRLMHLGDSFTDMVERHRALDVPAIAGRVFTEFHFDPVW